MAVRDLTQTEGMLSMKDMLPRDRYVARCTSEEFGESKSSGNPMITREWEIVHPDSVVINGQKKIIAGISVKQYLPTIVFKEDGKTRDDTSSNKALSRLRDENSNLGLPCEAIDDENPELCCKGVVADVILSSEESKQFKSPTPEQLAQGKKYGDPIKDDNGKDVVVYRVKLDSVLGRSSMVINNPY